MAKTALEREYEKQRKAYEKQAKEAERQNKKLMMQERAKSIVNGARYAADFRIMDAESEEVLQDILNQYDGNERNYINYTINLPEKFNFSIGLQFEKLQLYGMALETNLYLSGATVTITEAAKTYFDDKARALEKQKRLDDEAIAREVERTAEIKQGFQNVGDKQDNQSGLLMRVIDNQNDQISTLKNQLHVQEEQLRAQNEQLLVLKNIFASGEDGVAVQKEIMKILEQNLGKDHPFLAYLADKGGDIAFPALAAALKTYLISKGLTL